MHAVLYIPDCLNKKKDLEEDVLFVYRNKSWSRVC